VLTHRAPRPSELRTRTLNAIASWSAERQFRFCNDRLEKSNFRERKITLLTGGASTILRAEQSLGKMPSVWQQHYNPLGSLALSTLVAAAPVAALLSAIALWRVRIHLAAVGALVLAWGIAVAVYGMPWQAATAAALFGAAYGLFPIGWIILNLIFLYELTVRKGLFAVLRGSLATLAPDPRVQVILIAFSFGAFFEGAAGFGTPVAISSAILMQLGFRPLMASGLSLIANTAPVAFGALGTPVVALSGVTGIDVLKLSAMIGKQLPPFSLIIPFWVVWAMAGFRGMIEVWPAALAAGAFFAIPQYLISTLHGPWLVDIVSSLSSILATVVLLKFWRPKRLWKLEDAPPAPDAPAPSRGDLARAWAPWLLLTIFIFVWGLPKVRDFLNRVAAAERCQWAVPCLQERVARGPEVALPGAPPEKAIYALAWLSATGTGILLAALCTGGLMGHRPAGMLAIYAETIWRLRFSLLTIAAMLSLGYVTRYSGTDATLGLALAHTGPLYPFFGTLLGWLGVALTGSDTASNVLFGSLQTITARQLALNPALMAAANSSGGVMGKMVDAQSIVVASTATNWYGHEGKILRYVFFHSLALAALMGLLVFWQAHA
jgi:lactate permease